MPSIPDSRDIPEPSIDDSAMAAVTNSRGSTLYFDPADRRGRELASKSGEPYPHSLGLWELALGLRTRWDYVLDVGANYGEMLAGVALPDESRLVAFEPNPLVLPYLRRTLAELPADITIEPIALGDRSVSSVEFTVDSEWSGVSHLSSVPVPASDASHSQTVTVSQLTLDEYLAARPESLCIKIDVEGFEHQVLAGAPRTLNEADLVVVMIEILHMPVQDVLELARRFPLYLYHMERKELVRWDGVDGYQLGRALHAGDIYRQDALFLAGKSADSVDRRLSETCDSTTAAERRSRERARVANADQRSIDMLRQSVGRAHLKLSERLRGLISKDV